MNVTTREGWVNLANLVQQFFWCIIMCEICDKTYILVVQTHSVTQNLDQISIFVPANYINTHYTNL